MSPAFSVSLLEGAVDVVGPDWLVAPVSRLYPPGSLEPRGSTSAGGLLEVREQPADPQLSLFRDGQLIWRGSQRSDLLATLEWSIDNALADAARGRYVLIHAGVAARRGAALLLPSPSGGGKSTLTAGLVSAGFEYLSDEVAAIDPADGTLRAFARSVSLKAGGRAAIQAAFPSVELVASGRRFGREKVWFLRPPAEALPGRPLVARWVVLPRYARRQPTRLRQIPRSEAFAVFLSQSMNVGDFRAAGIARLVALLSGAQCFSLESGDLLEAVNTLRQLTDGAPAAAPSAPSLTAAGPRSGCRTEPRLADPR